jgi:hypothetical protein
MEIRSKQAFEEAILQAEIPIPHRALEQRIGDAHQHGCCHTLRSKLRALCDTARNDGGDSGGECAEEEEFDEAHAKAFRAA